MNHISALNKPQGVDMPLKKNKPNQNKQSPFIINTISIILRLKESPLLVLPW